MWQAGTIEAEKDRRWAPQHLRFISALSAISQSPRWAASGWNAARWTAEKKMHTNHMMYDYNRTKHKMWGIEYRESDRDGQNLYFSV